MSQCTFLDCLRIADTNCVASSGEIWACLCREHYLLYEGSLTCWIKAPEETRALEMRRYLSIYVKAQGGAKITARRTLEQQKAGVK